MESAPLVWDDGIGDEARDAEEEGTGDEVKGLCEVDEEPDADNG